MFFKRCKGPGCDHKMNDSSGKRKMSMEYGNQETEKLGLLDGSFLDIEITKDKGRKPGGMEDCGKQKASE